MAWINRTNYSLTFYFPEVYNLRLRFSFIYNLFHIFCIVVGHPFCSTRYTLDMSRVCLTGFPFLLIHSSKTNLLFTFFIEPFVLCGLLFSFVSVHTFLRVPSFIHPLYSDKYFQSPFDSCLDRLFC